MPQRAVSSKGKAVPECVPLKDVVGQHAQGPHVQRERSRAAPPLPGCRNRLRAGQRLFQQGLSQSSPPPRTVDTLSRTLTVLEKLPLISRP